MLHLIWEFLTIESIEDQPLKSHKFFFPLQPKRTGSLGSMVSARWVSKIIVMFTVTIHELASWGPGQNQCNLMQFEMANHPKPFRYNVEKATRTGKITPYRRHGDKTIKRLVIWSVKCIGLLIWSMNDPWFDVIVKCPFTNFKTNVKISRQLGDWQ